MSKKHRGIPDKDTHHLYPRETARFNGFNAEFDENKKELSRVVHERIHQLLGNKDPQEQIKFLFNIWKDILTQETKRKIMELINMDVQDFYIKKLYE